MDGLWANEHVYIDNYANGQIIQYNSNYYDAHTNQQKSEKWQILWSEWHAESQKKKCFFCK